MVKTQLNASLQIGFWSLAACGPLANVGKHRIGQRTFSPRGAPLVDSEIGDHKEQPGEEGSTLCML